MTDWDPRTLAAIDADGEMTVAAHRADGSLRRPRIVWHVVVDGHVYIRSVRGEDGVWYRGVRQTATGEIVAGGERVEVRFAADHEHDAQIDAAYRAKYGGGSAVRSITSPTATATTLRLVPC